MARYFDREIDQLKNDLINLTAEVEKSVNQSVRAVLDNDAKLAKKVIARDREIDKKEVEIEEECLKILALHQPVATDLRFLISALKINNDLERIGDLAINIAERAIQLSSLDKQPLPDMLIKMTEKTQQMLKMSLDALLNKDLDLAKEVLQLDQDVDAIHRDMHEYVREKILGDPQHVDVYLIQLSVSRNLERVADLAENIAEDVIYLITGEIIRHGLSDEYLKIE